MTRPDQLLTSAILACFTLYSLDVCSEPDNSFLIRFNSLPPIPSHYWVIAALFLSPSQSCTSLVTITTIKTLENP